MDKTLPPEWHEWMQKFNMMTEINEVKASYWQRRIASDRYMKNYCTSRI